MTPNQQIFADEYLKDRNATRAYMVAYPNVKNERVAQANSSKLLSKSIVSEYIDQQLSKLHDASVADVKEILMYLTSVMRGEITEQKLSNQGVVVDVASSTSDRSNAAKQLAKMLGAENLIEKQRLELEKEKAKREAEKAEAKDAGGMLADVLEAVNAIE